MNILKKYYTMIKLSPLETPKQKQALLAGGFVLLVVLLLLSLCVGAVSIPLSQLFSLIQNQDTAHQMGKIFFYVRLPRSLAAVLCGLALSLSGAILQTVLQNPMCSPSVIGVNAGAGLCMIVITAFFPTAAYLTPMACFVGALLSVLLVYGIAKRTGASKLAIVLAGIAVSSLFSALIDTVITLVPDAKISRVDFLIGSFSGITMWDVQFAFPYILVGTVLVFLVSFDINILALGDETATSLGMKTAFLRGILLFAAAMLAGSAISLSGLVGFVGLIVPHIARMLTGYDHRYYLPMTAILGGAFALGCDILSRILFIPYELPVGIVMSLLGAPFFLSLILRRRRRSVFD